MEKGQSIGYQLAGRKMKLISIFYIFYVLSVYFLGIFFGKFGIRSDESAPYINIWQFMNEQ